MNERTLAPDPIVLTGPPRSGVRLLAAILDSHPRIASGPDLPFVVTMALQWREIAANLGANHAKYHGLPPARVREAFARAIRDLFTPRVQAAGKGRFLLQSFAASVSLDVFAALFPASQFIFIVRDPRDAALSLQRCNWVSPRDGTPLPYTRDVALAARTWSDFVQVALRSMPALDTAGRLLVVRYEDLCANPSAALQRVGAFLRDQQPAAQVMPASAALVSESLENPHPPLRLGPVTANSVGRWRMELRGAALAAAKAAA